jgi:hypothetical protein
VQDLGVDFNGFGLEGAHYFLEWKTSALFGQKYGVFKDDFHNFSLLCFDVGLRDFLVKGCQEVSDLLTTRSRVLKTRVEIHQKSYWNSTKLAMWDFPPE